MIRATTSGVPAAERITDPERVARFTRDLQVLVTLSQAYFGARYGHRPGVQARGLRRSGRGDAAAISRGTMSKATLIRSSSLPIGCVPCTK